jgi:hypothetical protein
MAPPVKSNLVDRMNRISKIKAALFNPVNPVKN